MSKELEAIQILEKIFGSAAKVKIMRLFLFNKEIPFDINDVVGRTKVKKEVVRKEVLGLEKAGLLKKKTFVKEVLKKVKKEDKIIKKKVSGWIVNPKFPYMRPLQNFLIHINPLKHKDVINRISHVGKVKLVVVAGVFIQELESRVDLLVVGDNLNATRLRNAVREIEAEIGKELSYATFATDDFEYRHGMMDKLVRDILDFPHERIIDRLDLR
jgi:hypothetical protein